MSYKDIIQEWKEKKPIEAKRRDVETVIDNIFEKSEMKRGSHLKITDSRLLEFQNAVSQNSIPKDRRVAIDGSFIVPIKDGRKVIGNYIKRILHMIEIVEYMEKRRKE